MSSPHTLALAAPPAKPLAVLIADGGARIGFGHVGRCLALWEELRGRAVLAVEDAEIARVLRSLGAPVGANDGSAPVALIDRRAPTSAAEVQQLQARGQRVCLLDDPGSGRQRADLLVDPPTGTSWPPAGGRRLAGFEHVLLRRDIRAARIGGEEEGEGVGAARCATGQATRDTRTLSGASTQARAGTETPSGASTHARADTETPSGASTQAPGLDVLLAMGGSDPEGLTPALARALTAAGLAVTSVLGPAYGGPRPPGEILDPHDWPDALARAGLLVSRFGHTLLEAAYLETPALAVACGERAAVEARAFAAHGTARAIAIASAGDAARVAARALALRNDPPRLAAMAVRGRTLVDGLGANRVAAAIEQLAQSTAEVSS